MSTTELGQDYRSGAKLYGDDFDPDQIADWYQDEKEAYADLGAKDRSAYRYGYHALNWRHGFRHLRGRTFAHALGVGSAWGDEFEPVAEQIERLTILDPSDSFARTTAFGIPLSYAKPEVSGRLRFDDASFDLVTCFGVLHHIPNISFVLQEIGRCLTPGGIALVREPVISMGDWTQARPGLTPHERGIPLDIFRGIITDAGLRPLRETICMFPLVPRLANRLGFAAYGSGLVTRLDRWLSLAFGWNLCYHATSRWQKLRPTNVFTVLTK